MAEEINIVINTDVKDATKDVDKLSDKTKKSGDNAKNAALDFKVMGVSVNSLKGAFKGAAVMAKSMFATIKAGLLATGIGAFVLAIGALTQYFTDSEKGASKLRQITAQLGVAFGNVTDIISDTGKALFNLVTGNLQGFKDGLKEVTDGVKNFGETTKKEMAMANKLEKDRLALQIFERDALVSKAEAEKEMMRMRLQARDYENFTAEERLGFMRRANKLSDEQLEKDLKVAKEKLRFQIEENSYAKSTQANLDEEARLRAAVFQLERSNFSERKRMKSEEQAILREMAAKKKAEDLAEQKRVQELIDLEDERLNKLQTDATATIDAYYNNLLSKEDQEKNAIIDKYFTLLNSAELSKEQLVELKKAEQAELTAVENKHAAERVKASDAETKTKLANKQAEMDAYAGLGKALLGLAGESKEAAVASAIIDTYVGANKAFAQGGTVGFVTAAAVIVSGLANVKKIMEQDVGDGGGGGVSASTTPSAPREVLSSGAFTLGGGITPEPARAFVVSDDITDSQNKLANIRRRATI